MLITLHVDETISGVETRGSGGSMNRGPRALGAPSCGHTSFYARQKAYLRLNRFAANLVSRENTTARLFSFLLPEQLMTLSDCDL